MTRFKVLSAGLIAASMLTTPLMAREYRHVARSDVSATRGALDGRDCVRAPNVGAFASDPQHQTPVRTHVV